MVHDELEDDHNPVNFFESDAEEIDESGKKDGTAETDKVARAEAQAEEEMEQREALRWSAEARKCDWRLRTAAAECLAKLADDPGAAVAIVEPQPEAIPLLVQLLRVSDCAQFVAGIGLVMARLR